jgi:TRAP-type C4-dicarboxylate transport system permease large subunit
VDQELLLAFMAAGLFIVAFHFMRLRHDNQDQKTLQEAIRADSPIAAELFEQLRDRPRRRSQTTGIVLVAIAIAILGSGLIQGGEQNIRSAASAALFPALIGIVIYWRSLLKRRGG